MVLQYGSESSHGRMGVLDGQVGDEQRRELPVLEVRGPVLQQGVFQSKHWVQAGTSSAPPPPATGRGGAMPVAGRSGSRAVCQRR